MSTISISSSEIDLNFAKSLNIKLPNITELSEQLFFICHEVFPQHKKVFFDLNSLNFYVEIPFFMNTKVNTTDGVYIGTLIIYGQPEIQESRKVCEMLATRLLEFYNQ